MSILPDDSSQNAGTESPSSPHTGLSIPNSHANAIPDSPALHSSADPSTGRAPGFEDIPAAEQPLFARFEYVPPPPPAPRKPNFGDLVVFLILACGGLYVSELVVLSALHHHLFGVSTLAQARDEIHYKLGSQAAWYIITLIFCACLFPLFWRRSFVQGIGWRAAASVQHLWKLLGVAGMCFVVAILDEIAIPGPPDTPIDKTFHAPGAIWLLVAFGVTLAPLFEEIAYRGFLLPTLCTAYDWTLEQLTGSPARDPEFDGGPRWSATAVILASLVTSILFALMHGEQTSYSIGPFLLLVCISLALCWIRLAMRSLAACVLVHSTYNLLLFGFMFLGTGGFRHLERM